MQKGRYLEKKSLLNFVSSLIIFRLGNTKEKERKKGLQNLNNLKKMYHFNLRL